MEGAGIVYVVVVATGGDGADADTDWAPTTTSGSTTGMASAMGG